jgi:hypothetical protein
MALTNYLMQSIVLALFFYGYGFQLFGRLDPMTAATMGVAFYAAQLLFSVWWLKRYRFGPFEWVWRSMTYGARQPVLQTLPLSVSHARRASRSTSAGPAISPINPWPVIPNRTYAPEIASTGANPCA